MCKPPSLEQIEAAMYLPYFTLSADVGVPNQITLKSSQTCKRKNGKSKRNVSSLIQNLRKEKHIMLYRETSYLFSTTNQLFSRPLLSSYNSILALKHAEPVQNEHSLHLLVLLTLTFSCKNQQNCYIIYFTS